MAEQSMENKMTEFAKEHPEIAVFHSVQDERKIWPIDVKVRNTKLVDNAIAQITMLRKHFQSLLIKAKKWRTKLSREFNTGNCSLMNAIVKEINKDFDIIPVDDIIEANWDNEKEAELKVCSEERRKELTSTLIPK
jgi:hypothetical protein